MKHRCLRQVVFAVILTIPALAVADTMDDVLGEAKRQGLPVEALRHKIKEGRAKGVPEARIRAVVRQMVRHMKQAREWIRQREGKRSRHKGAKGVEAERRRLMISLAQARMAGLSESGLRSMVTLQKGAATRVDALVDMHLRRYRSHHALQLAKRASLADVGTVGATLDGLRKGHNLTHAEAADVLLRAVRAEKGSLTRAMRTITHRFRQGAAIGGVKPRARAGSSAKKGRP
jgi:hypothetical protein